MKEASALNLWRLQVLYIFDILWAIVTEVKGFLSLSRRLALSGLKGSFLLISLKTPSVIYFQNPLSNCDSVRSLPSTLRRITLPSLKINFYLIQKFSEKFIYLLTCKDNIYSVKLRRCMNFYENYCSVQRALYCKNLAYLV